MKNYLFKLVVLFIMIICSFRSLYAQDVYDSRFYIEFHKFFSYSSEQSGNYFFSVKMETDEEGNVQKYTLSRNLDEKMNYKLLFVLKNLDFTSLKPFLSKNSTILLPIFIIYYSGQKSLDPKTDYQRMWQFGSEEIKIYKVLPPIVYQDFLREKIFD